MYPVRGMHKGRKVVKTRKLLAIVVILACIAIAAAARKGDLLALQAFNRAGRFLGQAIADFLHIFNPTIVVLGGGVSQSYELFADTLFEAMKTHVMTPEFLDDFGIELAQLGDDVGLMGALALARESTNPNNV